MIKLPTPHVANGVDTLLGLNPVSINHLARLTDSTGIYQHAIFSVPNFFHGYCSDDNARALRLTLLLGQIEPAQQRMLGELRSTYLSFLWYALPDDSGRFRNFLSFNRTWLEPAGSEDCHGRVTWALGECIESGLVESELGLAQALLLRGLPELLNLSALRAIAFSMLGLSSYLARSRAPAVIRVILGLLTTRLYQAFVDHEERDWPWCEAYLSYDNPRLAQALIRSGNLLERPEVTDMGLRALTWLMQQQISEGLLLRPIGCDWVYHRGGRRPHFDQQPVEAWACVSACLEAFRVTGEGRWMKWARMGFEWFLGRNDLNRPVYDSATGGCRDGLRIDRLNQNQGAESTIAWLSAMAEMRLSISA
jgi:hypothetical protein